MIQQFALFALGTLFLSTGPASAQAIPFSQHGVVTQMVGLTEITVTYNRPVARGRTLFGTDGLVKWDTIWHPGADSATRISVSRTIQLAGKPLPKGDYSLWLIPAARGPWTLIVSRAARAQWTSGSFRKAMSGATCRKTLRTPP